MSTLADVRGRLLEAIEGFRIVDTHEHLPMEAERSRESDVLSEWLIHYFSCDLVSAGLSNEGLAMVRDPRRDLRERWVVVEPYWHAARSTGYGRSLDLAARDLYGIASVTGDTIADLNAAFLAAREKGEHYQYVLKERSRISLSLVDSNPSCDRRFFASVTRIDPFICPSHRGALRRMGQSVDVAVHRLEDWEETLRRWLARAFDEKGAVALKCGLAYQRSLRFDKAARADAERDFNALFADENAPDWRPGIKVGKAFQDYMMHAALRLAEERNLPIQVHTGLQEGNGNVITDSNPVHLTNLFLEYEGVRFDLFHMGYPYVMELSNLAKNFRNVFIDMCWGHIISPEAARRALVEWLDAVPANKISAFGGDYCFVDGVYGHQKLARANVAAALAQKVADGSFDESRALEIARWLFIDNPMRLFRLEERVREAETACEASEVRANTAAMAAAEKLGRRLA